MAADQTVLLEFDYGRPSTVDRDVDAFERFYRERFGQAALDSFTARVRRQSRMLGISLLVAMAALCLPVLINSASVFAYILLAMGLGLGGVGVFFLIRASRARRYCEAHLDDLLDKEFQATRTETKRVFHACCTDEGIEVRFGTKTGVKQRRHQPYDQMRLVIVTDELVFIQGLTWLCRFQMDEACYEDLIAILMRQCPQAVEDQRE